MNLDLDTIYRSLFICAVIYTYFVIASSFKSDLKTYSFYSVS